MSLVDTILIFLLIITPCTIFGFLSMFKAFEKVYAKEKWTANVIVTCVFFLIALFFVIVLCHT